jgi:Putative MetA-pathway of phenol degradation
MPRLRSLVGLVAVAVAPVASSAQQLEPRVYLAGPVNTNAVIVSVLRQSGDIVVDPTLPVTDAKARVGTAAFSYFRTFDFLGRAASVVATLPIVRGSFEGNVDGQFGRVSRMGQGDGSVRFTVNLRGTPALDLTSFAKRGVRPNLGASLTVNVPIGQYDATKLISLGANRWAYRPEVGLSVPAARHWLFDAYFGVWIFGDNTNYRGVVRTQSPLWATQGHVSYNLSPRAWVAFDATFYSGGRTATSGGASVLRQNNTRFGTTLTMPVLRRQALKLSFSKGAWVRLGTNFTTFGVAWSYVWGGGL